MMIDFTPKPFGNSGIMVPRVGLGAAPLGNIMGKVSSADCDAVLRSAFEGAEPCLVDTAPFYGAGLSEQRIGAALSGVEISQIVLSTKVGRTIITAPDGATQIVQDFSYDGAMRSLEDSMRRIGVDKVDIVHIHDPDDHFEEALSGAYRALSQLKSQGVIRAISAGMNQWQMLSRFIDHADFDGFLLAGRYTLLDSSAKTEFLPKCQRNNIGLIVGGVFNGGILADPFHNQNFDYKQAPEKIIARAQALSRVCDRYGVPLRAAAMQFALRHPAISGLVVGVKSADEWTDNVALAHQNLPEAIWADLAEFGAE